jgi:hypothetical protein
MSQGTPVALVFLATLLIAGAGSSQEMPTCLGPSLWACDEQLAVCHGFEHREESVLESLRRRLDEGSDVESSAQALVDLVSALETAGLCSCSLARQRQAVLVQRGELSPEAESANSFGGDAITARSNAILELHRRYGDEVGVHMGARRARYLYVVALAAIAQGDHQLADSLLREAVGHGLPPEMDIVARYRLSELALTASEESGCPDLPARREASALSEECSSALSEIELRCGVE